MAYSCQALAVSVESTTSIILTMRECVAGATACDTVGPATTMIKEGLPGKSEANATHEDPAFGEVAGDVKLTALPRISEHSARSLSLPGARNGGNAAILRKYTNSTGGAEIVTLTGNLSYQQSVPEENSGLPEESPGRSGAVVELAILRINADVLEAGATAEDNYMMLEKGVEEIGYTELGSEISGPPTNVSEEGTRTVSVAVTVEAGNIIWLWAVLQSFAANGAEAGGRLVTSLEAKPVAVE